MARPRQIIVCGAGAAGMAAAIAAARAGANVRLLESAAHTGGTVANVLIHTIGGLFDASGQFLNAGLARELAERLSQADPDVRPRRLGNTWVLNVCPDVYRDVTRRWLQEHTRITLHLHARATAVSQADNSITAVHVATPRGQQTLDCDAVIDATGSAEVVRLVDPALVQDEPGRAAGGLIVRIGGVAPGTMNVPKRLALVRALRTAAADGTLPAELAHAWLDSGVRADEIYLKLMVPLLEQPQAMPAIIEQARAQARDAFAYLRRWPEFAVAAITRMGELGIRDGGRIHGQYCLTAANVRQCRKFPDAACRCAWPIEFWDSRQGVALDYLPDGDFYEIPLRALQVHGVGNLWAAGKCLSADRFAHASARIAGACWAMGDAVGRAAADGG